MHSFICFSFPHVSAELPLGSSRDRGFLRPLKALPHVVAAPSWVPQTSSLAQPAGPHRYLPTTPANRTKMHIHPTGMTSCHLLMRNKWPAVLRAEGGDTLPPQPKATLPRWHRLTRPEGARASQPGCLLPPRGPRPRPVLCTHTTALPVLGHRTRPGRGQDSSQA